MFIIVNPTLRRFRLVIGDVFGTSEFLDETEPLISSFLISTASPDPSPWKTGLRSKQLSSKCAEHKHDDSVLRFEIFSVCADESGPFLSQTFVFGKVMHRYSRCSSSTGTVHFIGTHGRTIIRSSPLCSLVRHSATVFCTTNTSLPV